MAVVRRITKGSELTHAELDNNFYELDLGIVKANLSTGAANNAPALQAQIGSNRIIYIGTPGTYLFTTKVDITGVSNLKIIGIKGVVLSTTQPSVFDIFGSVTGLEITGGMKLISTRNSTTEIDNGVVNIWNFTGSSNITDIKINDLEITAPNSFQNGIKLIGENSGVMSRIEMKGNNIHDIQRFGIEFQNHVSDAVFRIKDYDVSDNYLKDIGTNAAGLATQVAISISGRIKGGKILRNTIVDVYSPASGMSGTGIENAYGEDVLISENIIRSENYGFSGIMYTRGGGGPARANCKITNNLIDLKGTQGGKVQIWGIYAFNLIGGTISDNQVRTTGYGFYAYQSSEMFITANDFYCGDLRVMMIETSSANNAIYGNKIDNNAAASNDGLVTFNGAGVTGNKVKGNLMRMKGNTGGEIAQLNGATGNDTVNN